MSNINLVKDLYRGKLIEEAIKHVIDNTPSNFRGETKNITYFDKNSFIVHLHCHEEPSYKVKLFLDGRKPFVTKLSRKLIVEEEAL
jgi:hypothetical protein